MPQRGKWILRGPTQQLPEPLSTNVQTEREVAVGQSVHLLGHEIDPLMRSFTEVAVSATVSQVFRDADGSMTRFQIGMGSKRSLRLGLVRDAELVPIGIVGLGLIQNRNSSESSLSVAPLAKTFVWEEPEIIYSVLCPQSGDRSSIVWQVAFEYTDPFHKLANPSFHYRRVSREERLDHFNPSANSTIPSTISKAAGSETNDNRSHRDGDRCWSVP